MSRSLTDRYLQRLRFRLAVLYAVAMAIALGILVYVVIQVDEDLRWSDMNQVLLERGQQAAGSVVFTEDGNLNIDRFEDSDELREGWPQVWLFEVEGHGSLRLTTDPLSENQPIWTRDGRRILFRRNNDNSRDADFFIADAAGGGQVETFLDNDRRLAEPAFSPARPRRGSARMGMWWELI